MCSSDLVAYTGLATLVLTGHAPLPAMCVLAVAAGTASALFMPAMDGIVPLIVPTERLQQANGTLRVGTNSARLLGLALSGVTVALVGAGWALALNAASFVVSAALTARLPVAVRPPRKSSGWADLREGWREFASRQWLWAVVAQWSIVIAALNANVGVLGPLTADRYLGGARAWSVIVAAQALGTIAGAGLAARVRVRRPILVAVLATFPAAVPIALLAVRAPVWLIAAAMFTAGISNDVFGVLWSTTIHREIPEESLSRVSSYDGFGSLAFAPLGLLIAGPLATTVGLGHTLAGARHWWSSPRSRHCWPRGSGACAAPRDGGGRGGGHLVGLLRVEPPHPGRRRSALGLPAHPAAAVRGLVGASGFGRRGGADAARAEHPRPRAGHRGPGAAVHTGRDRAAPPGRRGARGDGAARS